MRDHHRLTLWIDHDAHDGPMDARIRINKPGRPPMQGKAVKFNLEEDCKFFCCCFLWHMILYNIVVSINIVEHVNLQDVYIIVLREHFCHAVNTFHRITT
jgi:hypothetical protein